MFDENQKIGIGLCTIGLILGSLGLIFLFDRALLTLGNLGFLLGLFLILGRRFIVFFFKPDKLIGSIIYFGGIFLIIYGWSLIGWILEMYGVWRLFYTFLPNVINVISLSPFGFFLKLPILKQISKWIYDQRRLPL